MLDYGNIKAYAKAQGVTIRHLAQLVEMTDNGFKSSIETGNFAAKNVMLICEKLKISPNTFFGYTDNNISITQLGRQNNQTNNLSPLSVLEKQLEIKDSQIERLMNIIENK